MESNIIAICSPENFHATVGIEVVCLKCDIPVWLSDSTIESIKEGHPGVDLIKTPPVVLCIECGMEHIKNSGNTSFFAPTEKQINEIVNAIRNLNEKK